MSNENTPSTADNRIAVGGPVERQVRRLSDAQLQVARTEAERPLNVSYWAGWDDARDGWCVYLNQENRLEATPVGGPFATREEAEAALGPELKQLWQPRGA